VAPHTHRDGCTCSKANSCLGLHISRDGILVPFFLILENPLIVFYFTSYKCSCSSFWVVPKIKWCKVLGHASKNWVWGGCSQKFVNLLAWLSRKRRVGAVRMWNRFVQTSVAVSLRPCKYVWTRMFISHCLRFGGQ
jgi:hypothetical protein